MAHPRKDDCARSQTAREALLILALLRYIHWRLDVHSFPDKVEFNPIARHEGEDSEFRAACWALENGVRGTTADELMLAGYAPESCCADCWSELAQKSRYTIIHLGEMVLNLPQNARKWRRWSGAYSKDSFIQQGVDLIMTTIDQCL
jgi:hypothetical protein